MKILLVDDELHVIRAIRQLVPWEDLGISQVLEADSGRAALTVLQQESPEIVITDVVMQDLTGLELMQILQQRHPETKVIVMSGYSDFEYVHSTLLSGGIDYLLKPLDPQQLVRTIRRAVDAWEKDEEARNAKRRDKHTLRLISDLAAENLLERMLFQNDVVAAYDEIVRLAPSLRDASHCVVCFLDTDYVYNVQPLHDSPELVLLEQSLKRLLTQHKYGYLLRHPAAPTLYIIFLYHDFEEALVALKTELLEYNCGKKINTFFGVSLQLAFPTRFSESYRQAENAFYGASSAHFPPPIRFWREGLDVCIPPIVPHKEQAMFSAILSGNSGAALSAAKEWVHAVGLEGQPLYYVAAILERFRELERGWIAQLARRYDGLSLELSPMPHWPDFSDSNGLLSPQRFADVLGNRLYALCNQFQKATAGDAKILQIAHYLEENYEKPFSQEECAARFFMSRDYLCRRFTKELGISMVSYLNGIRIQQAKLLMSNPTATIRSIAHQVGFEDEKYFARQFKRIEGISPGEYRARLLK